MRPAAIFIIVAFLLLATLAAEATACSLLIPGTPLDIMWKLNEDAYREFGVLGQQIMGVFLTLFGIVIAAASYGFLHGNKWAWYTAVSIFCLNGVGDLLALALRNDIIRGGSGMVIAGFFLLLLFRPGTKRWFFPS